VGGRAAMVGDDSLAGLGGAAVGTTVAGAVQVERSSTMNILKKGTRIFLC